MSDELKEPKIKLPEGELYRIIEDLFNNQEKEGQLKRGDDSFLKKTSMIDKAIEGSNPKDEFIFKIINRINADPRFLITTERVELADGGDPYLDPFKEIAVLEGMVGIRPSNSLEAMYVEEMKDRLDYLKRLVQEDKK